LRLIVRDLTRSFEKKTLLDRISYTFEEGRIYGILGGRKSGKTAFLRCITGDLSYDDGEIILSDERGDHVLGYNDVELTFDIPILPDFMSGREFIRYYMDVHGRSDLDENEYLALAGVGADEYDELLRFYTDDVKRQLQLVTNLISGPRVLLLDEPFDKADEDMDSLVEEVIDRLKDNHIIIVTAPEISQINRVCTDFLYLNKGKLTSLSHENTESIRIISAEDLA